VKSRNVRLISHPNVVPVSGNCGAFLLLPCMVNLNNLNTGKTTGLIFRTWIVLLKFVLQEVEEQTI